MCRKFFLASCLAFLLGSMGCDGPATNRDMHIDSLQRAADSLRKDSVYSRVVKCTWDNLEIIAGLDNPGPDTFKLLEGMLYAERITSEIHQESEVRVMSINDSSKTGNKYYLTAKLVDFDSIANHFSPEKNGIGYINGKRFYGTDGEMPETQFGEISLSRNGVSVNFPVSAYADLYNPGTTITVFDPVEKPGVWYLSMYGSDGAGGYEVVWIFEGNKFNRRIVANSF